MNLQKSGLIRIFFFDKYLHTHLKIANYGTKKSEETGLLKTFCSSLWSSWTYHNVYIQNIEKYHTFSFAFSKVRFNPAPEEGNAMAALATGKRRAEKSGDTIPAVQMGPMSVLGPFVAI